MKTRTETHVRQVPHTVNGETRLVDETYTVKIPISPRDWDRIVLNGVTAVAGLAVTAAVVWSTASIGDLLGRAVVIGIAYAAAVVFDLAWIMCMALEWLARYDPVRARRPRLAGHGALVIAMAAVCTHGRMEDSLPVGVASAAVSALAKGMWTLVLAHHARPLDPRTQAWLLQREGEIGAELALSARLRQVERYREQRAALSGADLDADPDSNPDRSGQGTDDPDPEPAPPITGPMTVKDAVRTAADCGIHDPDAVLRYVRKVADANAKAESVARYRRDLVKGA